MVDTDRRKAHTDRVSFLLAEARRALPEVIADDFPDSLTSLSFNAEPGRAHFALTDEDGRALTIRLDVTPLPWPRAARTFVNTTSDNHVIQLSDRLDPSRVTVTLTGQMFEIWSVRKRANEGTPFAQAHLLRPGAQLPDLLRLSETDKRQAAELDTLAHDMADTNLTESERWSARCEFSAHLDRYGLRTLDDGSAALPPDGPEGPVGEVDAVRTRTALVQAHLSARAHEALGQLGRPPAELPEADAEALRRWRAGAPGPRLPLVPFPMMPGHHPDGSAVSREDLPEAVRQTEEARRERSDRTVAELRAEARGLPEGRYPRRRLMLGGGATLAGRDPDVLLVDSVGRWHVDPIPGIVQSADQVRHLYESGFGDPYQFADPRQRVPLDALRYWEDTAASRGPVVNGQGRLFVNDQEFLAAEIIPLDGSPSVFIEVEGPPLIATGVTPEIIPGCSRAVPTLSEAIDRIGAYLGARDEGAVAETGRELAKLGTATAVLSALAGPDLTDALLFASDGRITHALQTVRATAAWEAALAEAPGRVLYGDQVGDGEFDPFVTDEWLIGGLGGGAIANAEIILQANPGATVSMVGVAAPWVLHNDAQYLELRRRHDPEMGGDGRLVTYGGRRLGPIETVRGPGGRARFRALDVEGDAYVACLGRVARLPKALDTVREWSRARGGTTTGELLFDADRQYLGYRLRFEAGAIDESGGVSHTAEVTGAASRMLPGDVFTRADQRRVDAAGLKEAPAESGNVAAGFMATALQATKLAGFRVEERLRARGPLALVGDRELSARGARSGETAGAVAQRLAEVRRHLSRMRRAHRALVERMVAQAAPAEAVAWSAQIHRQDIRHAQRELAQARDRLARTRTDGRRIECEVRRRSALPPEQLAAEQAARRRLAAAPWRLPSRPAAPAVPLPSHAPVTLTKLPRGPQLPQVPQQRVEGDPG